MKELVEKRAVLKALLESMLATIKQEERAFTNDEIKILSSNIYKVLSLYSNENFVVYSISDDEYNNLIKNKKLFFIQII